jgi:curved DNA-binding protein CbpA
MSSLPLPPDPYKLLGVSKDATLPEIRSAHRKLVLKCHPDKVQDAALKAIKQDEFQKVQQAYELLSDDSKRLQYDEQVKLYELRKEMGRGNPTPRSNPFEYEVKTAEPRPSSYGRPPPPKVYSHGPVPRSYEDIMYEESRHQPKKSASYDSTTDRKRAAEKDEARMRAEYLRKRDEKKRE